MKLIKRHKSNINKTVQIFNLTPEWNNRIGTIKGFRGDHSKGIPYVEVFIHDTNSIFPFSAKFLKYTKPKTPLNQ